jgi:RHS repeat-associated protein
MRLERGTWTLIGWLLLLFGGWAHNAQAQQVPSRDVGKSTYFIPAMPGGSANVHPARGNFRYKIPLFRTSGVGPCTSMGLTYDSGVVDTPGLTHLGLGWTTDYFMRITQNAGEPDVVQLILPWGERIAIGETAPNSQIFQFKSGFGFVAQIVKEEGDGYQYAMKVDGGTAYLFNYTDGTLRSIVDPVGHRIDLINNTDGKPIKVIDMVPPGTAYPPPEGVGRVTKIDYIPVPSPLAGKIERITDPLDNEYQFAYESVPNVGYRLTSMTLPSIVINSVEETPVYHFNYAESGAGLLTKIMTPRAPFDGAGNYCYDIEYFNNGKLKKITDPQESYVDENGDPALLVRPTFELFYQAETAFNTAGKEWHTRVKDRRNYSTVYVFHTDPFLPGVNSELLSEIWDPVALSGTPIIGGNVGGIPGIYPLLADFDGFLNLTRLKDRWGNETKYVFIPNPFVPWMRNLLKEVWKPGPSGLVKVEEFTYTNDDFANMETHKTYAVAEGTARTTTYEYNDSAGRITQINHPSVTSLPDADDQVGITTKFVYEQSGRRQLIQKINENEKSTFYSSFGAVHGLPQAETRDGGAGVYQAEYNLMGYVTRTLQPQGGNPLGGVNNDAPGFLQTFYDKHHRVDRIIDPRGVTATDNDYDLDGNLFKVLPAGEPLTPAQAVITLFDKRGMVVGGNGPDGSWTQKIDANGNVTEKTSLRGYPTHYTYDTLGRLATVDAPGASVSGSGGGLTMTTDYAYDIFDDQANRYGDTLTRGGSRVSKTFFDSRRRKDLVMAPDGLTSTRIVYDNQDLPIAEESLHDGIVKACTVTFRDERDRVFRVRTQEAAYAPAGDPLPRSDIVYIRNPVGTVIEERDPLWDPLAPVAHRNTYQVDDRERVVTVTNGLGVIISENLYGDDDLIFETRIPDPVTKTGTRVTHEKRNYTARKELKEVFNRAGVRVAFHEYRDREGVISKSTNAAGVETRMTYHPSTWRVDEVIVAEGLDDGTGNTMGRRTASVWTNGLLAQFKVWNSAGGGYGTPSTHLYSYDQADRLERYRSPGDLIAAESTFYTEFGEVDRVEAGTKTIDYTYNSLGQVESVARTVASVTETESRAYGFTGLLTSVSDADRSETTQYHTWLGTIDTQDYFVGGLSWNENVLGNPVIPALDYTYDKAKFLLTLQDPQRGMHEWKYDDDGRLWFSGYGAYQQPIRPVSTISYTPGGLIDTTTLHDAGGTPISVTTFTYDSLGRKKRQRTVQTSSGTATADLEWTYNNLDLVVNITFHHLGVNTTIGYNARQEVTSEVTTSNGNGLVAPPYSNQSENPPWTVESSPSSPEVPAAPGPREPVVGRTATYVVDAAGNRKSQAIGGVTTTLTYNVASQLHTEVRVSTQTDRVVHSYDEWGNESTRTLDLGDNGSIDQTETYGYNELNLLSLYTNTLSGANWQYDYWPGGSRFSKTDFAAIADPISEIYLPRMGDVAVDYGRTGDGDIVLKNTYVQGVTTDSKMLRIAASGARRHFIGDAVGTMAVTLNDGGGVEQVALKDVFGVEIAGSMSQERYSGLAQRERDGESGLDYVRARMYDPRVGRFTQTDPLLANRPTEHYAYGANNPVSKTDPSGQDVTPDDWKTYNSLMNRLRAAKKAGNASLYNRTRAEVMRFAAAVYKGQGWLEIKDQETALGMVKAAHALPIMGDLDAETARTEAEAGKSFRGAVEETTGNLEAAETTIKVINEAAFWAGLATGVGALAQAGRMAAIQGGKAALTRWAAREAAKLTGGQVIGDSNALEETKTRVYAMAGIGPAERQAVDALFDAVKALVTAKASKASSGKGGRDNDLPAKGKPNSKKSKDDGKGNGQIREYGPDGRAKTDYDFGHDHGAGDPHAHDWDWSKTPPRQGGREIRPSE